MFEEEQPGRNPQHLPQYRLKTPLLRLHKVDVSYVLNHFHPPSSNKAITGDRTIPLAAKITHNIINEYSHSKKRHRQRSSGCARERPWMPSCARTQTYDYHMLQLKKPLAKRLKIHPSTENEISNAINNDFTDNTVKCRPTLSNSLKLTAPKSLCKPQATPTADDHIVSGYETHKKDNQPLIVRIPYCQLKSIGTLAKTRTAQQFKTVATQTSSVSTGSHEDDYELGEAKLKDTMGLFARALAYTQREVEKLAREKEQLEKLLNEKGVLLHSNVATLWSCAGPQPIEPAHNTQNEPMTSEVTSERAMADLTELVGDRQSDPHSTPGDLSVGSNWSADSASVVSSDTNAVSKVSTVYHSKSIPDSRDKDTNQQNQADTLPENIFDTEIPVTVLDPQPLSAIRNITRVNLATKSDIKQPGECFNSNLKQQSNNLLEGIIKRQTEMGQSKMSMGQSIVNNSTAVQHRTTDTLTTTHNSNNEVLQTTPSPVLSPQTPMPPDLHIDNLHENFSTTKPYPPVKIPSPLLPVMVSQSSADSTSSSNGSLSKTVADPHKENYATKIEQLKKLNSITVQETLLWKRFRHIHMLSHSHSIKK